jgi:hypothetical protein
MKKTITLATVATIAISGAFGQTATTQFPEAKTVFSELSADDMFKALSADNSKVQAFGDTVFYENFDNGIPSGWTVVDNTNNNFVWKQTTQPPGGQYSGTIPVINSTTKTGGFMQLPSDFYNTPLPPSPVSMDSYFQTDAIDCSNIGSVLLRFQQYFRYCCSSTQSQLSVWVSNNGTNWTEFSAKKGLGANTASPNPDNITINISSVAANQSTVYLRFHKQGASHYFWMIDDIAIVEGPTNDMKLDEELVDFNYPDGGYYTQTPKPFVGPLTFRADMSNNGSASQSNAKFNVNITQSGSSVYNKTSAPVASFSPLFRDTLAIDSTQSFTPGATAATYSVKFTVSSDETDQDTINNSKTVMFQVTDSVYARDLGTANSTIGPANYIGGRADGSELGTLYELPVDGYVNSMSVYIPSSLDIAGTTITFISKIWETNPQAATLNDYFASEIAFSDVRTIANADKGKWITVDFDNKPVMLPAGDYVATIQAFSTDTNKTIRLGRDEVSNQPPVTSFVYPATSASWGWIAAQPMIRLNFDATNSVRENAGLQNHIEVYPNPSKEVFFMNFTDMEAGQYTVQVSNLMGQIVYSENMNISGNKLVSVNLSSFAEGAYILNVRGDKGMATFRLMKN